MRLPGRTRPRTCLPKCEVAAALGRARQAPRTRLPSQGEHTIALRGAEARRSVRGLMACLDSAAVLKLGAMACALLVWLS